MNLARYLLGVAALLVICAGCWHLGWRVRQRFFSWLPSGYGALASILLGMSAGWLVASLLGAARLFTLPALVIASVVLGAAGLLIRPRPAPAPATSADPARTRPDRWVLGLSVVTIGIVAAQWAAWTADGLTNGIRSLDSLTYHLPYAANFAQTGQLFDVPYVAAVQPTVFYPLNMELLHAVGMLCFGSEFGSAFVNVAFAGLLMYAAWCVATRTMRDGRRVGALAVALVATACASPIIASTQPGGANTDFPPIVFGAVALAFLLYTRMTEDAAHKRALLLLAALSAGLAVSAKISMLPFAALLTVAVLIAYRRLGFGKVLLVWLGGLIVTGSFWYLLNIVRVGNPVAFTNVHIGGLTLPAPDWSSLQPLSASIAHYLGNPGVWGYFFAGLFQAIGPAWPVLLVLALLGTVGALFSADRALVVAGAVTLGTWLAYLVLPYTAGGSVGIPSFFAPGVRFVFPAVVTSMLLVPFARRLAAVATQRVVAAVALGITVLASLVAPSASSFFTWLRSWPVGGHPLVLLGTVVLAAALVVVSRMKARRRQAFAGAGLAVLVLAAGALLQQRYVDARQTIGYAEGQNTVYAQIVPVYQRVRAVTGARIGYSGMMDDYPFIGPLHTNRVMYLGAPSAHGGMQDAGTCQQWLAALRDNSPDYVVISGFDSAPPGVPVGPQVRQMSWTASFPGVKQVLRLDSKGSMYSPAQSTALYRVNPAALGGASCTGDATGGA